MKEMIHGMSNQTLISEWHSIRLLNSHCTPINDQQCLKCNLVYCIGYLTYEEVITDELMDRGLFDFAMNTCYRQSKKQSIVNDETFQYYS
ncbi:MAG: hypothetical protein FK733_04965 [Asgard group archaeon]|nr:hypothetical protein [Asgard group archaeon]